MVHIFTNTFENIMTRNNDESCSQNAHTQKLITKCWHKNFVPGAISSRFDALSSDDIPMPRIPSNYFHCTRQEIDNPISKRIHSDFDRILLREPPRGQLSPQKLCSRADFIVVGCIELGLNPTIPYLERSRKPT